MAIVGRQTLRERKDHGDSSRSGQRRAILRQRRQKFWSNQLDAAENELQNWHVGVVHRRRVQCRQPRRCHGAQTTHLSGAEGLQNLVIQCALLIFLRFDFLGVCGCIF